MTECMACARGIFLPLGSPLGVWQVMHDCFTLVWWQSTQFSALSCRLWSKGKAGMAVAHLGPLGYRGASGTCGGVTLSLSTTPVGLSAIVVERIDPQAQTGRVETPDHMSWAALAADGMPIGLQMIAPRFADIWLLQIAKTYESWRGAIHQWPNPN